MTAFGGFADSAAALALQPAGGFASEALSMGDALGGPAPHGFADFLAAAGGAWTARWQILSASLPRTSRK